MNMAKILGLYVEKQKVKASASPLATAGVSRHDVGAFWEAQPFDIQLPNDERLSPGEARALQARPVPSLQAQPVVLGYAWEWMVAEAAWRDTRANVNGKMVAVQRGQFTHSIRFMAEAFGWDRCAVARFIKRLQTETMIETSTETGQLVITICNYEKYQADTRDAETGPGTDPETEVRQERDRARQRKKNPRTQEEKEKKDSCDPAVIDTFEIAWRHYPRKVGKAAARKAWLKATGRAPADQILAALGEFTRATRETDPKFVPHLTTWLNQGRWDDDQSHAANRTRTSTEDLERLATISPAEDVARLFDGLTIPKPPALRELPRTREPDRHAAAREDPGALQAARPPGRRHRPRRARRHGVGPERGVADHVPGPVRLHREGFGSGDQDHLHRADLADDRAPRESAQGGAAAQRGRQGGAARLHGLRR